MILEDPKPSSTPASPIDHERTPLLGPSSSSDEPTSPSSSSHPPPSTSRQHFLPSPSSVSSASSVSEEEELPPYTPPESELFHLRRKRARRRRFWILLLLLLQLVAAVGAAAFLWNPTKVDDTPDQDLPFPDPPDWEPPEGDGEDGGGGEGSLGRRWDPSLPLPPSSDGFPLFCNPYPPSLLPRTTSPHDEEDPTTTPPGPLSSVASFSLPLDTLDLFIQSSSDVALLSFVVETQSEDERDDENALVEVVAYYDVVAKRDAVQICFMVPSDEGDELEGPRSFAGLGLYPPKDNNDFSPPTFTLRLRLPPNTHVPSFRALSLIGSDARMHTSPEDQITFGSIYVGIGYEKKAILLEGIHSNSLTVVSLAGDIFLRNVFVRDAVGLVAARGEVIGLEGELTVGAGALVDITVGYGTIILQNVTLSSSPSEHGYPVRLATSGDREIRTTSFNCTCEAGAIFLGFNEETPFTVGLSLISNSLAGTVVRLPPSYDGSVDLHSSRQVYRRYFNMDNMPDPLGLGRKPIINLTSGSKGLVGDVTWPGNESGVRGSVSSRTRIGAIGLSLETGWRWDIDKGMPSRL